jgi:hypothetical protein
MVKDDGEDSNLKTNIQKVTKQVVRECESIHLDQTQYNVNIDRIIVEECIWNNSGVTSYHFS